MNPALPTALPRYQSEVEHYIARRGYNAEHLDWSKIMDDFYAGVTVEECGAKIIQQQKEKEGSS